MQVMFFHDKSGDFYGTDLSLPEMAQTQIHNFRFLQLNRVGVHVLLILMSDTLK